VKTFVPIDVPADVGQAQPFLYRLQQVLRSAAYRAEPYLQLEELTAEPSRILPLMMVYADGALWNPGSGEGTYIRNLANSAWVFLGLSATANAATATKLQTARTLTIGSTGKTFDGSADVSWSLNEIGVAYITQPTETTITGAATLTIAQLQTNIIKYTGNAQTLTLPTASNIDSGASPAMSSNQAFDFFVINSGTGTATFGTNTGLTLVGTMTVTTASPTAAHFRVRKTGTGAYTIYRLA
jgi:mannose-6-phosphate isomerase-like protein (cupin superfamily)